jgi:hypothetical protein
MTRAARVRAVARAQPLLAAPVACLAGCGAAPQTGLVAEVTTDLVIPVELDEVRVTVTAPDGSQLFQQSYPLGDGVGRYQLPMRIGFFPQGGGQAPVRIEAGGWLGTALVVSRSATLGFLPGKVVVLPLPLLAICAGKPCAQADQTCVETGRCEGNAVDPTKLAPYHRGLPDAGAGGGAGGATGDDAGGLDAAALDGARPDGTGGSDAPPDAPAMKDAPPDQARDGTDSGRPDGPAPDRADAPPAVDTRPDVPPPPPPGGLLGFWSFDQQGTTYPDRSGNGNDAHVNPATGVVAPTWLATLAERSGVVRIDASQSWLEVAPSSSLNTVASAFTMAAWIYIQSRPGMIEEAIVTRQIGQTSAYGLALASTGALECIIENPAALAAPLPLGTWLHVAAVYDGQSLTFYIEGLPQVPVYALAGPPLGPTQKPLIIGALNSDFAGIYEEFQGGAVDDVAVYNRALSASEIAALAAGNVPGLP